MPSIHMRHREPPWWVVLALAAAAFIIAMLAIASAGCAVRLPAPASPLSAPVRLGINGSYHGPLDAATISHLCMFAPFTLRASISDIDQVRPIADSVNRCQGLDVLLLIEDDNLPLVEQLATWLASGADVRQIRGVELGNERNYVDTPQQFGYFVAQGAARLESWRGVVYAGGISDVRPETIRWWQQARDAGQWPMRIGFAIHRYAQGDGTPASPQDGYNDRQAETRAIRAAAAGRRIAVSETGYVFDGADSDELIASMYRDDVAWFSQLLPEAVIFYQLESGPSSAAIDHWGWRKCGQVDFRPAIDAFFARPQ